LIEEALKYAKKTWAENAEITNYINGYEIVDAENDIVNIPSVQSSDSDDSDVAAETVTNSEDDAEYIVDKPPGVMIS
jgi:hypothetical protein